jgi:hypothetical protein
MQLLWTVVREAAQKWPATKDARGTALRRNLNCPSTILAVSGCAAEVWAFARRVGQPQAKPKKHLRFRSGVVRGLKISLCCAVTTIVYSAVGAQAGFGSGTRRTFSRL